MKKAYVAPVVEKVTFDYKTQIVTASSDDCFESVMNVKTAESICGEGTSVYIGWTLEETGV